MPTQTCVNSFSYAQATLLTSFLLMNPCIEVARPYSPLRTKHSVTSLHSQVVSALYPYVSSWHPTLFSSLFWSCSSSAPSCPQTARHVPMEKKVWQRMVCVLVQKFVCSEDFCWAKCDSGFLTPVKEEKNVEFQKLCLFRGLLLSEVLLLMFSSRWRDKESECAVKVCVGEECDGKDDDEKGRSKSAEHVVQCTKLHPKIIPGTKASFRKEKVYWHKRSFWKVMLTYEMCSVQKHLSGRKW